MTDHIRYDLLAQKALRGVVRTVLIDTAKRGLQGDHHFFISFDTRADDVRLSTRLREQYPEEMTIVLQYQFWDLKVAEDEFEVGLSFNGVAERLTVPFSAIKSFVDPSAQFVLQFEEITETMAEGRTAAKAKSEKAGPKAIDRPSENANEKSADKTAGKSRRPVKQPVRSVPIIPPAPAPAVANAAPAPALANAKSSPKNAPSDNKADKPDKPDKPVSGGAEVVPLDRFRKK